MLSDIRKSLTRRHLSNPAYGFLLEEDTSGEAVALAATTSSFDAATAEPLTVAAVVVRGNRILTSTALDLDLAAETRDAALDRLLHVVGARPLVGYYLGFTVGVLDKLVRPFVGIDLPNPQTDVSSLYYDRKLRTVSKTQVDLRFDSILADLDLPPRGTPSALGDAVSAALIWLKLKPTES
jgi:DNA polymerase-3 subunit epsilon